MRGGDISTVCGVFHYVVAARGVRRAEEQTCSADEFVCAVELGAVAIRYVGYARGFFSCAEYGRAAVAGRGGSKMTGDREGRAGWGGDDDPVGARGASGQEPMEDIVVQDVMGRTAAVCSVRVDAVDGDSVGEDEIGKASGSLQWTGEKYEDALGAARRDCGDGGEARRLSAVVDGWTGDWRGVALGWRGIGALGGAPRKKRFVEVDVGRVHDAPCGGDPDAVGPRHASGPAEVHADQRARLELRLRDGHARLHRVGAASEWHDGHDRGPRARERLIGGDGSGAGGAAGSVQYVDRMFHGIVPKRRWRRGRREIGASELHYGAYCALGHAVQSMHVRRRCRGVHEVVGE
eukprot:6213051-Pleurochrysis_carterae.AAC.3